MRRPPAPKRSNDIFGIPVSPPGASPHCFGTPNLWLGTAGSDSSVDEGALGTAQR